MPVFFVFGLNEKVVLETTFSAAIVSMMYVEGEQNSGERGFSERIEHVVDIGNVIDTVFQAEPDGEIF